ncbi:conserved hypothetical protein [Ricinus communis]|uniref:Uncharacterized protein n=1 Tax=Ricinus communis TaxID=3988 RepID=B9T9N6_RICCO|nr:conserved hypothetical protein [Ricinus communis]
MISRCAPQAPPDLVFTSSEMELLERVVPDLPLDAQAPPLLRNLIKVARLGGYLARAGDSPPGNTVMWRGMQRLTDIQLGYELALNRSGGYGGIDGGPFAGVSSVVGMAERDNQPSAGGSVDGRKASTRGKLVDSEVVPIDLARRAFLSLEPRPAAFNFRCSNQACRDVGVRVVGANYRRPAQEGEKFQAAHFRHWVGDVHLPGCEWLSDEESDGLLPGETEEAARQRRVRRKLTDFVTIFDPRSDADDSDGSGVTRGSVGGGTEAEGTTRPHGPRETSDEPGQTRSRDLERLVNNFREAKESLSRDELESLEIRIVNIGHLRLVDYFVPITRAPQVSDSRLRARVQALFLRQDRWATNLFVREPRTDDGIPVSQIFAQQHR